MSDVKELKDEELEKVNGGTILETMDDHKAFKQLGLVSGDNGFSPSEVRETFKKFGIRLQDYGGVKNSNQYFYGDREITREEALQIVVDATNNK